MTRILSLVRIMVPVSLVYQRPRHNWMSGDTYKPGVRIPRLPKQKRLWKRKKRNLKTQRKRLKRSMVFLKNVSE